MNCLRCQSTKLKVVTHVSKILEGKIHADDTFFCPIDYHGTVSTRITSQTIDCMVCGQKHEFLASPPEEDQLDEYKIIGMTLYNPLDEECGEDTKEIEDHNETEIKEVKSRVVQDMENSYNVELGVGPFISIDGSSPYESIIIIPFPDRDGALSAAEEINTSNSIVLKWEK